MNLNISGAALPIEFQGDFDLEKYKKFRSDFNQWIMSSKQSVKGLPRDNYIVSGITDAFHQTYSLYNKIGIYYGEYGYHEKTFPDRITYNLKESDVIIISHPFSADGECSHHRIKEADKLGIPIFIDCAFFGICSGINFDFSQYENIHSICFSLSKTFGTGWQRVGLLYTIDDYPVKVYADWQYPFTASSIYHYDLINNISPDYMYEKYHLQQKRICDTMNIFPSSTVIFGLDYSNQYKEFKRGYVNRLCISKEFKVESI
jgi:hypothetical protein